MLWAIAACSALLGAAASGSARYPEAAASDLERLLLSAARAASEALSPSATRAKGTLRIRGRVKLSGEVFVPVGADQVVVEVAGWAWLRDEHGRSVDQLVRVSDMLSVPLDSSHPVALAHVRTWRTLSVYIGGRLRGSARPEGRIEVSGRLHGARLVLSGCGEVSGEVASP